MLGYRLIAQPRAPAQDLAEKMPSIQICHSLAPGLIEGRHGSTRTCIGKWQRNHRPIMRSEAVQKPRLM